MKQKRTKFHLKNKKMIILAVLIIFIILILFIKPVIKSENQDANKNNESIYNSINLFTTIIYEVKHGYYKDISISTLISYAIEGMLEKLDPYSSYLKKEDFESISNYTNGDFFGIGIQFFKNKNNMIEVLNVIDNSPAKKSGVLSGDLLLSINNKPSTYLGINDVLSLLKEKDNNIELELSHIDNTVYKTTLSKEKFSLVPLSSKLFNNILYIKIPSFNKKTYIEVRKIINSNKNKTKGLIIDLRSNGGGLLDPAVKLADLFLNEKMIAKLENKNNGQSELFMSTTGDILNNQPLIILINDSTASASEVLAGSLQENKRALIVGTKSFGKGVVQDILAIGNGDYIKLTTSEYILPSNKKVDNKGIIPDIIIFQNGLICKKCSNNELAKQKGKEVGFILENKENKDYQLNKALEIIQKENIR